MILWLDHKIFGNGRGIASPGCDNRFYWLNDKLTGKGRLYTFMSGFGAQLHSYEWFMPAPGTRRVLAGRDFVPFSARRRGIRVEVAWCTKLPSDIDGKNACLDELSKSLGRYW